MEGCNRCAKLLRRWLAASIPNLDPPPDELIDALCDDLNTPKAIAEMHRMAKSDGRKLFASLRFMGLLPGEPGAVSFDIDGMKTIPIEHIPLVQWVGFETVGAKT